MHKIAMLGAGLIGRFYTMSLLNFRGKETFYDGYVVNTIIDACYKAAASKKWEEVEVKEWRG